MPVVDWRLIARMLRPSGMDGVRTASAWKKASSSDSRGPAASRTVATQAHIAAFKVARIAFAQEGFKFKHVENKLCACFHIGDGIHVQNVRKTTSRLA